MGGEEGAGGVIMIDLAEKGLEWAETIFIGVWLINFLPKFAIFSYIELSWQLIFYYKSLCKFLAHYSIFKSFLQTLIDCFSSLYYFLFFSPSSFNPHPLTLTSSSLHLSIINLTDL